jgi:hypothetical protein
LSNAFVGSGKKDWQWISADGIGVSPARSQIPVAGAQRLAHEFRLRTETGLVTSAGFISARVVKADAAKLSARAALAASGVPQSGMNYAVKSSFLLSFLESVPKVFAKLKEPNTGERKFEDVVKSAEQAAVLVLVY